MLFYIYRSASGTLASMSADEVGAAFSDMLASHRGTMVGWMILAVLIAFGICALGLAGRYGENHESHDEYTDRSDRYPGDSFSGIAKCHGRSKVLSGSESGCHQKPWTWVPWYLMP